MTSMLCGIVEWFQDFFMSLFNLIPKIIYLLYTSLACLLDVFQLFFRKLAGLDVYYVEGEPVTGDLVTNFITAIMGWNKDGFEYSALSTVFWAMVLFGIILCFACTIVSIVKSHYTYDDKSAKGPMQFVYTAGKALINIVAVPVIVILGLYVSEALLTALDSLTSVSSASVVSIYGDKASELLVATQSSRMAATDGSNDSNATYIYYDMFGYASAIQYGKSGSINMPTNQQLALVAATNQTFSGSLFKAAAYNGNRARIGQISPNSTFSGCQSHELFGNCGDDDYDKLAEMIDTAFACNLHLKNSAKMTLTYNEGEGAEYTSLKHFTTFLTREAVSFSKFNVGLVWYYYDLWQFNFIVGFAGCIVCVSLFINIIFGMMSRLFMCVGLFLIYPPLFGLAPFDGGNAAKGWRQNFSKQVLMAYGAVVGMNIMFLILPYLNTIDFFNVPIIDVLAQTLIIIVGLITIKAFISVISGLIGAEDANKVGEGVAKEAGSVAGKATAMTIGAAKAPINSIKAIKHGAQSAVHFGKGVAHSAAEKYHKVRGVASSAKGRVLGAKNKVANKLTKKQVEKRLEGAKRAQEVDKVIQGMAKKKDMSAMSKDDIKNIAEKQGVELSRKELRQLNKARKGAHVQENKTDSLGLTQYQNNALHLRGGLKEKNKKYGDYYDATFGKVADSHKVGLGLYADTLRKQYAERIRSEGENKIIKRTQKWNAAKVSSMKHKEWAVKQGEKKLESYDRGSEIWNSKEATEARQGGLIGNALSSMDSMMGESNAYNGAKEGIFGKKPDPAKQTAKNTAEIAKQLKKMNGGK